LLEVDVGDAHPRDRFDRLLDDAGHADHAGVRDDVGGVTVGEALEVQREQHHHDGDRRQHRGEVPALAQGGAEADRQQAQQQHVRHLVHDEPGEGRPVGVQHLFTGAEVVLDRLDGQR
jgi:hypothetical protein